MKLDIEIANGRMRAAWEEGIDAYAPVFRGEPLTPEGCLFEVSLKNLRFLLDAGLKPRRLLAGPNQGILVEFACGSRYLATGFGFGYSGDEVAAFAQICEEAGFGPHSDVFYWLEGLPQDLSGEIPLDDIPPAPSKPLK